MDSAKLPASLASTQRKEPSYVESSQEGRACLTQECVQRKNRLRRFSMSVFAPPMASDWQPHRLGSQPTGLAADPEEMGLGIGFGRIQTSTLERPALKSHKSFPSSLTASNYAPVDNPSTTNQAPNLTGQEDAQPAFSSEQKVTLPMAQPAVETTYGGSAPASPAAQISPTSAEAEQQELGEEDEDLIGTIDEEDQTLTKTENDPIEKTAEQRRAEKRKMKRFRYVFRYYR